MSRLYRDSKDSKRAYFESVEELGRIYNKYSIEDCHIIQLPKSKREGLDLGKGGIPLSLSDDGSSIYIDQTDSHSLIIGPTGSKKSRLVAMPMVKVLGIAKESMIISDPKAEIYGRTANGLIDLGYKVVVLNLRSPDHGEGWNPLTVPYKYFCEGNLDKAYEFTNDIAINLTRTEASTKDPFWDNSAGSLFFGLSILLFKYCAEFNYAEEDVHIGNIIKLRNTMLSGSNITIKNHPLWRYAKSDNFISSSLIGTAEAPNDTRASILSVFDQKMRIFSIQPNLVNMLSYNTINFDSIDERPTAIYLILPDEKTSYHNLVSLFIKQSYEYLINKAQQDLGKDGFTVGRMKTRVNYILDEFSSLPTISDFPAMITAARSRNIRFNLFIQSKHQLLLRYAEESETLLSNCSNWIFLTSRELKFLQELSALCGNTKDNQRPILTVADLQKLDKQNGEALLLLGRLRPHIARLADIDSYDHKKFKTYPYPSNANRTQAKHLEFSLPKEVLLDKVLESGVIQEFERLGVDIKRSENVENIVDAIDKRIAELEKEESQENNTDNNNESI